MGQELGKVLTYVFAFTLHNFPMGIIIIIWRERKLEPAGFG